MTRPGDDFKIPEKHIVQNTLELLKRNGINLIFRTNIHQKFSIIDQRIVWYGSINFLSFGTAQESIMRIESSNIAIELIKRLVP
jgi:phosphatidylserine/phosphatidylglycerophosphate/cardiolipin synthase-like enzyme